MRTRNKIRLLLLLFCTGSLYACDGGIQVRGNAYTWINPPQGAGSKIIVDNKIPFESIETEPLEGVNITIFHGGDYNNEPLVESTLWQDTVKSNTDGSFSVFAVTAPKKFSAIIRAEKEGYKPVDNLFLHDKNNMDHEAIILLIKNR